MPGYHPADVERRWQQYWESQKTFRTADPGAPSVAGKPKYYILDMFPYPSGAGLHVGHPEGYTATDILARFKRMNGFHVLHPMGWDAYGLPAEEYARKTGTHPRITTVQNINTFRRQIKSLGFSYDWDREVDTTDPDYFRWTQFVFLVMHDTWYDPAMQKGRPIAELPIPADVLAQGETAVRKYQDDHRLAFQAEAMVNWCPAMGTVLANEEVSEGRSEVGGHPVERRPLRQWLMRITTYADRLLNELEQVDWPESIKQMQRNWIGRSIGAEVDFWLNEYSVSIRVFTTRPDTLYGATYMVLAPEHPLVDWITDPKQKAAVQAYKEAAARKSEQDRTRDDKTKTGVPLGVNAINPVTKQPIPVWIADYVLVNYGTGAIMAVPGHDERDFAFAKQFDLPIATVVKPTEQWLTQTGSTMDNLTEAYCEEGLAINSGILNGLPTAAAKELIIQTLELQGIGKRKVNFKLRDWLFSRQRYWGEPFPLLHELDDAGNPTGVVRRLSMDDLPLRLPDLEDFNPTGSPEGPVAKATDWMELTLDGKRYRRESNTMPQWAGSCWYYLRYIDPRNSQSLADPEKLKHWLPVDLYVGGAEHAVLHLLYSRFWHKVLYDRGFVPCPEPFQRLVNQGMILGEVTYTAVKCNNTFISFDLAPAIVRASIESGNFRFYEEESFDGDKLISPGIRYEPVYLREDEVVKIGNRFVMASDKNIRVDTRAHKMSKSRGNVVNPDDIVKEYGADSLRLYEMFMGPLEATKPWNTKSVEGVYRFLSRVWRLIVDDTAAEPVLSPLVQEVPPEADTLRLSHKTIRKVGEDTEALRFNTAISAMMELSNHLTPLKVRPKSVLESFVLLLAPYAPHIAEELWAVLGHSTTLAYEPWPVFDPALTVDEQIEIPVQIGGKLKTRLMVPADIEDAALEAAAKDHPDIVKALEGKTIKRVIVKSKKLVNIVAD